MFIRYSPGAGAEGDLQHRVAVQEEDDGDEEAHWECEVGFRFVGLVEGMAF